MRGRTKKLIIHFNKTFSFDGSKQVFPPGDYSILEDEELIEGNSWLAYRRKATFIQFPAIGTAGPLTQMLEINHDELNAILDQDVHNGVINEARDQNLTGEKHDGTRYISARSSRFAYIQGGIIASNTNPIRGFGQTVRF